jgi:hypothetical protein
MSRTAEAVQPELTQCPCCGRLHYPPHEMGCFVCRRSREGQLKARATPRIARAQSVERVELEEAVQADTHYFLESYWGHPDEG